MSPPPIASLLAPVLCDAWFEIAELPTRWASASLDQRRTFQACASAAVEAARTARDGASADVEGDLARAIDAAFWASATRPAWATWDRSPQLREICRGMAAAAISAGRRIREARRAA